MRSGRFFKTSPPISCVGISCGCFNGSGGVLCWIGDESSESVGDVALRDWERVLVFGVVGWDVLGEELAEPCGTGCWKTATSDCIKVPSLPCLRRASRITAPASWCRAVYILRSSPWVHPPNICVWLSVAFLHTGHVSVSDLPYRLASFAL